jgi:hypothetical protein
MRTAVIGNLGTQNPHKHPQTRVAEEIMDEVQTGMTPEVAEVLRRIDSLKSAEHISLDEKIRIAELVLSVLEEENKDKAPILQ